MSPNDRVVNPSKPQTVLDEASARAAFARVKPELHKLASRQLLVVNVNVGSATDIVLRALPRLHALRPRLVKELPLFNIARFDRLEDYALALSFTQAALETEPVEPNNGRALRAEATRLRATLLIDTRALPQRALIDPV